VWSRTRRYPGLETQNNRDSYCLSDFPMPKHYPEWPKGEQVQAHLGNRSYLASEDAGVRPCLCSSAWRARSLSVSFL
jgi:cation diffusion facilitator CzcD-associated flavoprotein CzcO